MNDEKDPDLYTIVLRKEESAGEWAWVASAAELPGCTAVESSPEEALRHIRESIVTWLEVQGERRGHIPDPYGRPSGHFTVRIPSWVHRELKLQAQSDGTSLNQYVTSILSYWAGLRNREGTRDVDGGHVADSGHERGPLDTPESVEPTRVCEQKTGYAPDDANKRKATRRAKK